MSVQAVLEYMVNRVPWYKWSIRRIWSIFPRKSNLHLNASETSIQYGESHPVSPIYRPKSNQNRPINHVQLATKESVELPGFLK